MKVKLPESGTLEVVVGLFCPARCPFCVNVQKNHFPEGENDVFLQSLEQALLAAQVAGTKLRVGITGGEPTDAKYFVRTLAALDVIARFADVVELSYLITHGGNLLKMYQGKTIVQQLAEHGLGFINVSYHHWTQEGNQAIVGLPIPSAAELATAITASGIGLRWHCVLRQDGVKDIEGVLAYIVATSPYSPPDVSYNFKELYDYAGAAAGDAHGIESLPFLERAPARDREQNFVSVHDLVESALQSGFVTLYQNNFALRDCTQISMSYENVKPIVFSSLTVGDEDTTEQQTAYWVLHPDGLMTSSWTRDEDKVLTFA